MSGLYVAAGALTGLVVGMTGVGGGALMTPLLVLAFGTAPLTAVGTDLWFAALTKLAVSGVHVRQRLIDWPIVVRLWMGSLPAAAIAIAWMHGRQPDAGTVAIVRGAIAIAVCVTAAGLLAETPLAAWRAQRVRVPAAGDRTVATIAVGVVLGALVTLTSVGAGALGAVALLQLYPSRLTPPRLVATDIAHAIPLALVAGVGHLSLSNVDGALLRDLLAGSIPGALAGALISSRVSHTAIRVMLGVVLLVVGITMLL